MREPLTDEDYRTLAGFRHTLRGFLAFSEGKASAAGITAQQHQAMLAIRASPGATMLVGELAQRLWIKPHSASEHVDRLTKLGLVQRDGSPGEDRRRVPVRLTAKGEHILDTLSQVHREELRRIKPLLVELITRL
jgi:DNA-binding MarR family transcriptional regulator